MGKSPRPHVSKWRKHLSIGCLVSAILAPIFYFGAFWLENQRLSSDHKVFEATFAIIYLSALWVLLTTIVSIVSVFLDRKSALAWSAAVISLIESGAIGFVLVALREFHP